MRFCGAGIILVTIALLRRRPLTSRRDAGLAVVAGLGQLAATFCLFAGFKQASPGFVTLLFYVYPLLVTLGDRALFGVTLGRTRALLLATGMLGIVLTVGDPGSTSLGGAAWGLGAGVFTSGFILLGRHTMSGTLDSFQFVALAFGGAAVTLLAIVAVVGMDWPPSDALPYAAALIVLSSVVPMLLFYAAIRMAGAGTAARLATVEPVTAVILSYVVLGDPIAATQLGGGALVVTSVVLLARS